MFLFVYRVYYNSATLFFVCISVFSNYHLSYVLICGKIKVNKTVFVRGPGGGGGGGLLPQA